MVEYIRVNKKLNMQLTYEYRRNNDLRMINVYDHLMFYYVVYTALLNVKRKHL